MGPQALYAATKWGLRGWSLSCYEVCNTLALPLLFSIVCATATASAPADWAWLGLCTC